MYLLGKSVQRVKNNDTKNKENTFMRLKCYLAFPARSYEQSSIFSIIILFYIARPYCILVAKLPLYRAVKHLNLVDISFLPRSRVRNTT